MLASLLTPSQHGQATTGTPTSVDGVDVTDLEPSDEWKTNLKKIIEGELMFMVKDAKDQLEASIRLNPEQRDQLLEVHQSTMGGIRRLAEEQYQEELGMEREELRWAAGMSLRHHWMESLREEQEVIYQQIQHSEKRPLPEGVLEATDGGSQEQPPELQRPPQLGPEPTRAQSSTIPIPRSQRTSPYRYVPAPLTPRSASSPHGRYDLQQESLRRKAEQQRPPLPTWASSGQAAEAPSISASPPPPRSPSMTVRPTPSPRPPPSQTPAPPPASASSLPRPIDRPSTVSPLSERHTTAYSPTAEGLPSSPPPQIWKPAAPSEDQAYQQPHFTSTSTSSVNNMNGSASNRAIPSIHRRDNSASMRSVASTRVQSSGSTRIKSVMDDVIPERSDHEGDDNSHDDEGHDIDEPIHEPEHDYDDVARAILDIQRKTMQETQRMRKLEDQWRMSDQARGSGHGGGGRREDEFDFASTTSSPYATAKPRHPMIPVQLIAQSSSGESKKSGKSKSGSRDFDYAKGYMHGADREREASTLRERLERERYRPEWKRELPKQEREWLERTSASLLPQPVAEELPSPPPYQIRKPGSSSEDQANQQPTSTSTSSIKSSSASDRPISSIHRKVGSANLRSIASTNSMRSITYNTSVRSSGSMRMKSMMDDTIPEISDDEGKDNSHDEGHSDGGSRRPSCETVPLETSEQAVEQEKERQKKRTTKEGEEKEREERERERLEKERERERLEQERERLELEREEKRVSQEREREREGDRQREREREQEKERDRQRQLDEDNEEGEAREREEERKNTQTEKMLQELKDAREKAEEALRLAQEAAEFKKIAEEQAEELKRRMENADKLTRQALAKHGEAERQHREALELQERATMKEESARRKELDILQREKDLTEKEAQLQKLEEETKHQEEQMKHEEELSAKKEETERLDEESRKKRDLEGAGQLDEGGRNTQMGNVRSASVDTRGEKATFGPEVEKDREMGAVPASEITKKWKTSLKSRIDQEIGILIQLNRQWFEENVSNVKEDDRLHLQTELKNITRSLDVLHEISLEMFSGEVAEMVLLVERGSTEVGEAVTTDAAGDDREECGASTASRARVPGPKEEPQALDPGRREGSPEIELVKAADEPVDEDKINEASVATQLEKVKNVNTPRQKSSWQGSALSSFAGARHFVIHHATFINSETANISPSHGMWDL